MPQGGNRPLTAPQRGYYVCGKRKRERWDACQLRKIDAEKLEQAVVAQVSEQVLTRPYLQWMIEEVRRSFSAEQLEEALAEKQTRLGQLDRTIAALVDAIEQTPASALAQRLAEREDERQLLLSETAAPRAKQSYYQSIQIADEALDVLIEELRRGLLADEATMRDTLLGEERETASTPIRARIEVVDGLLADNQHQLDRLLDLYLAGDFSREALTDRKARLEATISSLERERIGLITHLEQQILSAEHLQSIREFAAQVRQNLDAMSSDPDAKRRLIESLDVRVMLTMQDGQAVVHASCILHPEEIVLDCVPEHKSHETASEHDCRGCTGNGPPVLVKNKHEDHRPWVTQWHACLCQTETKMQLLHHTCPNT